MLPANVSDECSWRVLPMNAVGESVGQLGVIQRNPMLATRR